VFHCLVVLRKSRVLQKLELTGQVQSRPVCLDDVVFQRQNFPVDTDYCTFLTDDLCTIGLSDTACFGIDAFLTEQAQQEIETIWKNVRACGNTGMWECGNAVAGAERLGDTGYRCIQISAPSER
jgi:hypothetical protein